MSYGVITQICCSWGFFTEGLGVLGFVFGLMGMVAFVRLEKLTKELKAKGVLDEDYKEE